MKRIISFVLIVIMLFSFNTISYANTQERALISKSFTLNDLKVMFPDASTDIEYYINEASVQHIDQTNSSNLLTILKETKQYVSVIDSTSYTLVVYENGYLGLYFSTTTRSMKYFSYYVWGLYQSMHQLVASVFYYSSASGQPIMTAIGVGGSGIHYYGSGINDDGTKAYAQANAYYEPEGFPGLEEDYFGMQINIKSVGTGFTQENLFVPTF